MATRHERRQTMQRLLRSWQHSGKPVRTFCARRKIPVSTFFRWKRRLHGEPVIAKNIPDSAFPAFLQVSPSTTVGKFEYRFADGGSLVLPGTLELADVAALVRQLRGVRQ